MVPNVVRNMKQRARAREKRARHRLSFDFENPSLGAVTPSASDVGDVQMVNLGGGESGEAAAAAAAAATTAAATTAAGDTAVDIAELSSLSSSSSSSSSSATAGEVKTTDSARSSKTKRKKKKGSKNRPETLPGSFMAAPPPAPTRGAVESSADVVDAGATRRKRLASIHARKKEIMQHKNPMKNKHTL